MLEAILGGEFQAVLGEWLELARARGVRAPEELLPALLAAGPGEETLAVVGERGRWLAGLDERLSWAAHDEDVWRTGTLEARSIWLSEQRSHDPAAARAALEETWETEDPEARATFVERLAVGLSPDDEPFLEHALDDRRREVRRVAAALLAQLPDSALAGRMRERARPLLHVSGGRRPRIEVQLPDEPDAVALRDGIVVKAPQGFGQRAWWLRQIVGAAPLALWEQELGRTPAELVKLRVADNLAADVHWAWASAAVRQENPEWAAAVFRTTPDKRLLGAMRRDDAERAACDHPELARELPPTWGRELSLAVVRKGLLDAGTALYLHPSVLDDLPHDASPRAVAVLQFRHDLHKELA
jgi:hypothetical protein